MEEDFFKEIIEYIKENKPLKQKLANEKIRICSKHKLNRIPTDIEILLNAEIKDIGSLKKYLQTKPTRTISGVAIIAIMTRPFACPHGACTQCPGGLQSAFGDVPQSYTGKEPATMRAIRNNYDSYLQVFNRLEQYIVLGQNPDKVELIIMGGTFPSFPEKYQEEFIKTAFKAMNDFSTLFYKKGELNVAKFKEFFALPGNIGDEERIKKIHKQLSKMKKQNNITLEKEQIKNEKSAIRCVGLTIETRPDYAKIEHANKMLSLGCTRVELGVQSVYDKALTRINRGHDVNESIKATRTLKDLGFKINYHMMLGMPGVSYLEDLEGLKQLFENQNFRPDMLKLYPCMVLRGTKLFFEWQEGRYKPLTTEQATRLIIEFKKYVPEYVRIMRVQRDIPTKMIEAGVDRTNLRQMIESRMSEHGLQCRCIRCREIKNHEIKGKIELKVNEYKASNGEEYFISLENNDSIIGFCRLRIPSQSLRKEIPEESALIRELHVYGTAAKIGKESDVQHRGFGKQLLLKAEKIAKNNKRKKMIIISGVGVRGYYRKQGYKKQGPYMIKKL
jgi:elongator complex protein 3